MILLLRKMELQNLANQTSCSLSRQNRAAVTFIVTTAPTTSIKRAILSVHDYQFLLFTAPDASSVVHCLCVCKQESGEMKPFAS